MTDKRRYPKAYSAKWKSGSPTVATSGATFVTGSQWQSWNGKLLVAKLKGKGVMVFTVSSVREDQAVDDHPDDLRADPHGAAGPRRCALLHHLQRQGDGVYKVTASRR